MKNVYKVAFEKNFDSTNLLFFISSISSLLLSYFVSSLIFWISVPLTVFYAILFFYDFDKYISDVKRLKNKEEYLKDGKHTISTYSWNYK